jgi:adenosylmethionine-8-amino-7-oxononanoate aminotransferase
MVAFDLDAGTHTGYLSELAPRLRAAAIERGVLLRPLGNVLYALPPACTTEAQCDAIADAMAELAQLAPEV